MATQGRRSVLSLYKKLMRLHQKLPSNIQAVGSTFIREEFKKHRSASGDQAREFVKEWMEFAHVLEEQVNSGDGSVLGRRLSSQDLNLFNNDQVLQLKELHEETNKSQQPKD